MVADAQGPQYPDEPNAGCGNFSHCALGQLPGVGQFQKGKKAGVPSDRFSSRGWRKAVKEKFPWGVRYPDGREVCNLLTKAGRDEYHRRVRAMWERQGGRCCLEKAIGDCPGKLRLADAMFEHQDGRGMDASRRDDRMEKPDRKTGMMLPYNGAAHAVCNSRKGSIRIDYHITDEDLWGV